MPEPINDYRICELPTMRVLVSQTKGPDGKNINDMGDGLREWVDERGLPRRSGMREEFSYFDAEDGTFVFLIRVADDFENTGPYPDTTIPGGLVAVVSGERDQLTKRYNDLMLWIRENDRYELDAVDDTLRHNVLMDWLTPQDIHRDYDFEQQDIFVPVRRKIGQEA